MVEHLKASPERDLRRTKIGDKSMVLNITCFYIYSTTSHIGLWIAHSRIVLHCTIKLWLRWRLLHYLVRSYEVEGASTVQNLSHATQQEEKVFFLFFFCSFLGTLFLI